MAKTLLVAYDGSYVSQDALKFAISMARAYGDHIRVVNVQQSHELLGEHDIKEASAILEEEGVPYTTTIRVGMPSIEILAEARDKAVRCIVMGSKGKGNTRNDLGSVSMAVLAMAFCPVVVIPAREP